MKPFFTNPTLAPGPSRAAALRAATLGILAAGVLAPEAAKAATFSVSGTTLAINLTVANESVAITSAGSTYALALTGGTWSGTDGGGATGNGTTTLTATAASFTAVTIDDGSTGNAVTFNSSGANSYVSSFTINLDDASAGVIAFNGNTAFTGTAALSASTSLNLAASSGTLVSVVDGDLSLFANQQASPTLGVFTGIRLDTATLTSSGSGKILLKGKGGTSSSGREMMGIVLNANSVVSSTSIGSITLNGKGGAGQGGNYGVFLVGSSSITTVDGAILVTGQASTSNTEGLNRGLVINSSTISSTGLGTIGLTGIGGSGTSGNTFSGGFLNGLANAGRQQGIRLEGSTTSISSVKGDISLNGTAGSSAGGTLLIGVAIAGGTPAISSTGTGANAANITIVGNGASGNDRNWGVEFNAVTTVTTVDGDITATGIAGAGTVANNVGIQVQGKIQSTGTGASAGKLQLTGTGADGTVSNHGLLFTGSTAQALTVDGNIQIDGTGGPSTGNPSDGLRVDPSAKIAASGSGAVTITGIGGQGAGAGATGHIGVRCFNSDISTVDGNLSIIGTGGPTPGTAGGQYGIVLAQAAKIKSTGLGTVTLDGRGGGSTGSFFNEGIQIVEPNTAVSSKDGLLTIIGTYGAGSGGSALDIDNTATVSTTGTGNILLKSDRINIVSTTQVNAGLNTVTLVQKSNGKAITLGAADSASSVGITDAELDRITAGTVIIGNASSGAIAVNEIISPAAYKTLSFGNNVTFNISGGFSADVGPSASQYEKMTVTGTVTINPGATLALASTGGYTWNGTDTFTLLANDGTDAISGTFTGPTLANFLGSGLTAFQGYNRDTGNDLVIGANAAPQIGPDTVNRPNTTRVSKVLKSVLISNDTDAELDPLSISAVGNALPAGATVVMSGNFVVYTAPATNAGNGSFTYTLSDGPGGHAVLATVSVFETGSTASATAPNAVAVTPSGADFVITFVGVPNTSYRVQYTTSLSVPFSWLDFSPPAISAAAANGVFTYTDVAPGSPVRLYRAIGNP